MFKKKNCPKCNSRIKESHDFCPSCGNKMKEQNSSDWGMLGKNDNIPGEIRMPTGLNMIFNTLMKALDSQFKQMSKEMEKTKEEKTKKPKKGISISITTSQGKPPEIKVDSLGKNTNTKQEKKEMGSRHIDERKQKKFSKLPKENPETNVRRLSDKVIYELNLPDIKSIEDVSIMKLENSIEIKAVGDKKGYSKIIPVTMNLRNYELSEGKLLLELDANE